MDLSLFDEVADALSGFAPRELGQLRYRAHRFGIKVWFDDEAPPREHYEAQVVSRDHVTHVTSAIVAALEVGFHAEHPRREDNDAVISRLIAAEPQWRPQLGDEPEVGAFLGRDSWGRVSEIWPDPDLTNPELALEIAARLTDYVTALEPARQSR